MLLEYEVKKYIMIKELYRKIVPEKIRYLIGEFLKTKEQKKQELIELETRANFYSQFVKNDDLYFDVGANVGNRVAPMLRIGAKVVAVEPQKLCVKRLKNLFGNKIVIEHTGLGAKEEIRDFYVSDQSVLSTFSTEQIEKTKDGRFKTSRWEPTTMRITTMDALINKYGVPAFVKIDVEGFEFEVLKGLSMPVRMISLEYTVPEMSGVLSECINRLNHISDKFVYNYSVGESMKFALNEWLDYGAMMDCIQKENFIKTGFGDIYAKINIS